MAKKTLNQNYRSHTLRLEQRFPELGGLHSNFCPAPDEEGVENVKRLYQEALGYEISTTEAYEVLARVMRFLWAINLPEQKPEAPPSPETVKPALGTPAPFTSDN